MQEFNYKLVLLPGLDGTGDLFKPFLDCFPYPDSLTVISYPNNEELDYDELANIALKQLPESGFILLAESFSGPIAARLSKHPNVVGIIFCASFLSCPRPVLLKIMTLLPSFFFKIRIPKFLLRTFFFGKSCNESMLDLFESAISKVDPAVLRYRFKLIHSANDLTKISEINIPILCLVPTNDLLVPNRCSYEILESNSYATKETIKGAHFLAQTVPDEVKKAILIFVNN